jgi:hypothetical protein
MVALGVGLLAVLRRLASPNRGPRSRLTDGIAALVLAVLLIGNIARGTGGDDKQDAWSSGQGAQMKAGFIDGCEAHNTGNVVDCGCAFDHVTAEPPYDTPDGLASLYEPSLAAQQSRNLADVPAVMMSAIRACVRQPTS